MGFSSYQTAWSWLHKIRRAMVRPERAPLAARVEADETYVGGPRPGRSGRGAAGKTRVAGAVESGRGQARGRRLGRLRLAVVADVSARSLEGFLAAHVAGPRPWPPTADPAMPASAPRATATSRSISAAAGATRRSACRRSSCVRPGQALAARHPPRRRLQEAPAGLSRRVRLPLQPPYRQDPQPPLRRVILQAVLTRPTPYRSLVATGAT